MFKTKTYLLSFCLLFFSQNSHAQIEKLTPDLINQYGLNFSSPDNEPYSLWVGTQFLIDEGYNVSVGALYLRDNNADTFELISKTLQDEPAVVTGRASVFSEQSLFNIDATDDYELITYISESPDIAPGDSGNNQDVFVYNRTTQQTIRVEGSQPHQGTIFGLKISPTGNHLAYLSTDKDFGIQPSMNGDGNAIYIYNLDSTDLITLPHVRSFGDPDLGDVLTLEELSADGQYIFFSVDHPLSDLGLGALQIKLYNITTEEIRLIYDASSSGYLAISNLVSITNSDYMFRATDFIGDLEPFSIILHYDLEENQVFELGSDAGYFNTLALKSANNRYIVLYQSFNIGFDSFDTQAGQLWMLDTITNETRPIFDIKKTARTHDYAETYTIYCDTPYVLNLDFFQSNYFPCGENLTRDQFLLDEFNDTTTDIFHRNSDSFNIQPKSIRFHNDARYITFEGNSWYIDEAVSFEDFPYKNSGYPDYLRNSFVAVNPFLTDINISGTPSIDRSSETGLYVWQRADGKIVVKTTAGDPAQAGESTLFRGSLTSAATISNLAPFSVESDDSVTQNGNNEIIFELNVSSPWEDRFTFDVDVNASLCVDLTDFAGGLFIGPDKVQVTPPYDIGLLQSCESYQINVEGRPSLNRFSDRGWFIWRQNNGQWRSEFIIGSGSQDSGVPLIFEGNITSSSPLTNLVLISIENSDILNNTGSEIDFTLTVPYRWFDGFRFTSDPAAQTCVSLTAPADENIFIGVDKVPMPKSFDLNTLQPCDSTPGVETMGRPSINRSADNGIFVWENANRQWQAEVVSGDMPRTVPIDIVSQQAISNVGQINIESNDVFNIMQNALDLSLRVRSPWLDGFRFTDQAQSNTCISTTNSGMPIYLGPNRVELGNSLNLDTLTSCQ